MATVIIPLNVYANQELETVLDGVTYIFQIRYNQRIDAYTFNLLSANRTPLVSGVRIVNDYSLLSRYTNEDLPPGKLVAIDQEQSGADVSYDELGGRVVLAYQEAG